MRLSWVPATLPMIDPPTLLACRELVTLQLSAYFLFHRCPNIRLRPLERWRKIIMFFGNVGNSVTMLHVPEKRSHSHTAMKTSRPSKVEEHLKEDEPKVRSSCVANTNKVYDPLLQCWLLMPPCDKAASRNCFGGDNAETAHL